MEKTPEELKAEQIAELERQLNFLKNEAKDWKTAHKERWEQDVARVEAELEALKPKVEEKKKTKKP